MSTLSPPHFLEHKSIETHSNKYAESTELDEYVRKTVLESTIDSLGQKLETDKVRQKKFENFPRSWFWEDFRLGGEAAPSSAPAAGLSELCEFYEKTNKNAMNIQIFYFYHNKT